MNAPTMMRDTLQAIVERFEPDQERLALFTSFNFSPRFFEDNVLPLLTGNQSSDLAAARPSRDLLNTELKRMRVVVVCDRSTVPAPKGDYRYGLLTVGLPAGRFHSKIVLIAGILKETGLPGLWLSVGSGNLSLGGWANNREVVASTPVAAQHASELTILLSWLLDQANDQVGAESATEEGDLREVLGKLLVRLRQPDQLHPGWHGMPSLHMALPFTERAPLVTALTGGQQWQAATVISPYWSDVDKLADSLGIQSCRFVPALTQFGYAFPLSTMTWHGPVSFAKFDDDRYTHAKALLLEGADNARVLCIGSANFTGAALTGSGRLSNVEAVLRYQLPSGATPWPHLLPLDAAHLHEAAGDDPDEQAPPVLPVDVSVTYDWARGVLGGWLTVFEVAVLADIELEVAGRVHRFTAHPGVRQVLPETPLHCVRPQRSFTVRWRLAKGAAVSFQGLVTQLNAHADQLRYAPPPRLDQVLQALRELSLDADKPEPKRRNPRTVDEDDDGDGDGEETQDAPSFDYFALFQASWKLRAWYDKSVRDGQPGDPFDPASRGSVARLYRAITLQPAPTTGDCIGRYIQLAEVDALIRGFAAIGVHPPDDAPCRDIGRELDGLLPSIRTALAASPSFRQLFGGDTLQQVEAFLAWFHQEMQCKEENSHV